MAFIVIEIETDPEAIVEEQLEKIRDTYPNFVAAPASLERLIIEANAEEASIQRFQLQELSEEAPQALAEILGVPRRDAAQAIGEAEFTFADADGHLIPEGTDIAVAGLDGVDIAFTTTEEVTVPPAETTGTAPIEAIEEGEVASGLSGSAVLLSDIADVESVEIVGVTQGGTDGETVDEFLSRWADRMQLISDRLIQARDFSRFYRTVIPACARAVALDNYNPGDDTYDNEGMVTVCGIDVDGQPLSSGIKAEAHALMTENTISGLTIHVVDPTYTPVDVEVEIVALEGYDLTELELSVAAALEEYLSPANWGRDPTGIDSTAWLNERTVRYLEVSQAINQVPGVHFVLEPTLEIEAAYNTDFEIDGAIALTEVGDINVTVHEPGYDGGS
jgi:hypothetical protein